MSADHFEGLPQQCSYTIPCSHTVSKHPLAQHTTPFLPPHLPSPFSLTQLLVLGPPLHAAGAVDAPPDAAVDVPGHGSEGQAAVDLPDGPLDGGRDAAGRLLGRGGEVADVALPAGAPAGRLRRHALGGAGHHHVQRGEHEGAGPGEGQELGGPGGGDADWHFVFVCFGGLGWILWSCGLCVSDGWLLGWMDGWMQTQVDGRGRTGLRSCGWILGPRISMESVLGLDVGRMVISDGIWCVQGNMLRSVFWSDWLDLLETVLIGLSTRAEV